MAGALAFFKPWQGFTAAVLLILLFQYRSNTFYKQTLLIALVFGLGLLYAFWRGPVAPDLPNFLDVGLTSNASTPHTALPDTANKNTPPQNIYNQTSQKVILKGTVTQVQAQYPNRLNMVLDNIYLSSNLELTSKNIEIPYAGKIRWTWYDAEQFIYPGAEVTATAKLMPLRGFANPQTMDSEKFWYRQGVFLRALSTQKDFIQIKPNPISESYRTLYQDFLLNLPTDEGSPLRQTVNVGHKSFNHHVLAGAPTNTVQSHENIRLAPGANFLPALLFGDRSFITLQEQQLLNKSTLSHSLALSGLHLGYAVILGATIASIIGYTFPRLWLKISRQSFALLLATPLAVLYLWLGQAPISLLRASFMLFFWVLLIFLQRPKVMLDGLLMALGILLIIEPASIMDLRLQLSALSVAAIALSMPYLNYFTPEILILSGQKADNIRLYWVSSRIRKTALAIWQLCLISLIVNIILAPLLISAFGFVGLLFPLNALWLPVLGVCVMPLAFTGLILSAFGLHPGAALALQLAAWFPEQLMRLLALLEQGNWLLAPLVYRPHWTFWVGYWLVLYGILKLIDARIQTKNIKFCSNHHSVKRFNLYKLARRTPTIKYGICIATASILWFYSMDNQHGVFVKLLDVGQGQAALIQWNVAGEKGRALIDGGTISRSGFSMGQGVLAPVLTERHFPAVDLVIYSHPDIDHLGGLLYILENFKVSTYAGNGAEPTAELREIEKYLMGKVSLTKIDLRGREKIQLAPGLYLEVLWPLGDSTKPAKTGNEGSLLLRLVWNQEPLTLFCGDLGTSSLNNIVREKIDVRSQVLVLPHHGSKRSLHKQFYENTQAVVAVASAGYANQWNFPTKDVQLMLAQLGIPLYSTNAHGQVTFYWQSPNQTIEISTTLP